MQSAFQSSRSLRTATYQEFPERKPEKISILAVLADRDEGGRRRHPEGGGISILAVLADRDLHAEDHGVPGAISILAVLADRDLDVHDGLIPRNISILAVLADRDHPWMIPEPVRRFQSSRSLRTATFPSW